MEQSKSYQDIDDFEAGILSYINIKPSQYRKANLKVINVHYLEFNWQKKKGPTVLLLHGYGASSITYFKIIPGSFFGDCFCFYLFWDGLGLRGVRLAFEGMLCREHKNLDVSCVLVEGMVIFRFLRTYHK